MTDPAADWSGPAAFLTAAGALVASIFRRGASRTDLHIVRTKTDATVLKVAVLEARYSDIDRRLTSIEAGQVRLENKVDRLLEQ